MAITHNEVAITWPTAANYYDITYGSSQSSEAVSINTAAIDGMVGLQADNQGGTPASGDTIDFYILYECGDIEGGGGDDFDTTEHAIHLATLNTYPTDTPGEDPAVVHVPISIAATTFKIHAVSNASSNTIRVSARYCEVRG